MPADHDEVAALRDEKRQLEIGLRRCRDLVNECRSSLAANANGDYRPPYQSDNRSERQQSRGARASE